MLERLVVDDLDPSRFVFDTGALQVDRDDLLDLLVVLVDGLEQVGVGAEIVRSVELVIEVIVELALDVEDAVVLFVVAPDQLRRLRVRFGNGRRTCSSAAVAAGVVGNRQRPGVDGAMWPAT